MEENIMKYEEIVKLYFEKDETDRVEYIKGFIKTPYILDRFLKEHKDQLNFIIESCEKKIIIASNKEIKKVDEFYNTMTSFLNIKNRVKYKRNSCFTVKDYYERAIEILTSDYYEKRDKDVLDGQESYGGKILRDSILFYSICHKESELDKILE